MDQVIDQIRAALVPDASNDTRTAGAVACRAVLAALEPEPSEAAPAAPIALVPELLAQLGAVPPGRRVDVALDLAIARLRALLPQDAAPIEIRVPRFPLVPLGAHVRPGGGA